MVDDLNLMLALRNRLRTIQAVVTGPISLSSGVSGYTRTTGSFVADGFKVGMEVASLGFPVDRSSVIIEVTDLTLGLDVSPPTVAAAGGRQLIVGLPTRRAWDGVPFDPTSKQWYVETDYIPGPVARATLSRVGQVQAEPIYVVKLYGLSGTGSSAIMRIATAVLKQFPANLDILVTDGHVIRVKSDPAPYSSQMIAQDANHVYISVTIPAWVRSSL